METLILLVEAALVAGLGVWMTVAVYDNWSHPDLNRQAVAMVMSFELMERDYPDDFAIVAHRKIDDPKLVNLAFQIIRLAETAAAIVLMLATLLLLAAALGWVGWRRLLGCLLR